MTNETRFRATSDRLSRDSRHAGFTLIEVLVAITVLSVIAIAIQRALVVAVTGTERADRHIAAEMVARTLLSGPLGAGTDATLSKSGKMNGFVWTLRFQPLNRSFPATASDGTALQWRAVRMQVSVGRPAGTTPDIRIETIRLVRIAQ